MRRCHKQPTGLKTEWFSDARSIPEIWDTGLPAGHFLLRETLAVHEATGLPLITTRYAMLRSGEAVLAQAAFQTLHVQASHVKEASMPGWQYRGWKLFTNMVRPRLLVGGQLFRHDVESLHWNEALTPFEAFRWYRSAVEAAGRSTRAAAVLIKELPIALAPHFLHAAPEYLLLRNDISMQLPISADWQDMKDYEKSLKHKYAQRFRKVRQSWEGLDVRELNSQETTAAGEKIYELYMRVTEHQPVRMGVLSKDFIPTLKRAYPDALKVWGIWEGETMVAFASGWVNADSFDMFYIGFDYERNAVLNLYFNILFFAIEQGIMLRKPMLILGRTALEAKARVGCKPQYLNTFLYVRNPLLRRVVATLQARFGEAGSEWEQRHPFKNQD